MKRVMKDKKVMSTIAVVVLAVALFASGVVASPPMFGDDPPVASKISYQGQLTDSGGNPLDGTYDMGFLFYNAATGGSQVGSTITKNNVEVTNGLFNVELEVDQSDFDGQGLWLEVIVEGETLSPRQEIVPVPYALSLKPGATIEGDSYYGLSSITTDSYGLRGESSSDSLGAGVIGINTGGVGDGIQAVSNGRAGIAAWGEGPGSYAGYFSGDVHVTDGLHVDGPATGFFPRPAYDSGWVSISQGETKTLTHNLGGDTDNYVVDMTFKSDSGWGVNQLFYGGMYAYDPLEYFGAYWRQLTGTFIQVVRFTDDVHCNWFRVRIWVYK